MPGSLPHGSASVFSVGVCLAVDKAAGARRLDRDDVNAESGYLASQCVAHRLEGELRGRVGSEGRAGDAAADRADIDDATGVCDQLRKQGLGQGYLAEEVALELSAPLVDRQ